ncbi:PREDICTED: tetratricopeptide repeat protein 28-like [Branchiostoma belcheri]|uniref:Tetratricopeptide repeat protein 28-like n=1 Tax=Branchiostoma belcheri TaxID=7741 RepID=A0A6P4YB37_BRABE|nr:PREDICTED: tetratricopeptide repeat protein 28-like [Branchiostoma belcheri]
MEDSEPQDSDNIIQDTSAPEDNGSNDSGPEETEVKSVLNPEGASDTAETLFMARNLRRMDGENQVYVRRRLAQKLERQQEDLKKKQESENKTKPQNAGNAHGSNCKLLIMTCFLLPSLLLAIVCLLSSLIRNEKELNYYMLGLSNFEMGQYESALWWFLKDLEVQEAIEDEAAQINARVGVADAYRLLGKTDQATFQFNTALQLAQLTGNLHGQMQVYFSMGDMEKEQFHSPRTAIQYYEQALALPENLGDIRKERMAYIKLGLANYENKEYETALEWDQKFLMISQNNGNKIKEITAHKNAVDSYKALGRPDQARYHYQSALTIAKETGNKQEQMNIYLGLGDLHRKQLHEPQESHKYYTEMLALAKDLGNKDDERLAYNRLGLASGSYQALGKLDQARSHYQSAINIAIEIGNKQEQMDIYLGLGDLHREQLHEPHESHKCYTEMLTLAKDLKRKNMERLAYNRLGLACGDMQDNEAALEWHQKNLMLSKEHENKNEPLIAHKNTARSYQALSKPDQARSHFQSALDIAMETGNKQEQIDIYLGLGDLHREQLHEPQESHKYYTEMLALAKEIESKEDERLAYGRLGVACEVMQDNEAALGWYQKYLEMSQTGEDKTEQITVHKRIAASYQALGKLDQARSHYQSALDIAMETGNKQKQEDITKSLANL